MRHTFLVLALVFGALSASPAQSAADASRFLSVKDWKCTWSIDLNLDVVENESDATVVYQVGAGVAGSCVLPLENRPVGDFRDWHLPSTQKPTLVSGTYHTYWKRTYTSGPYEGMSFDATAFGSFSKGSPLLTVNATRGTYSFGLPNATFTTSAAILNSSGDVTFDSEGVISPLDPLDVGLTRQNDLPLPATGDVIEGGYQFDAMLVGFGKPVPCTLHYRFEPSKPERTISIVQLKAKAPSKSAGGSDFVFSKRKLVLYAKATVTPHDKAKSVRWDVPQIAGTTQKVDDKKRDTKTGVAQLTVTYTGLPSSNAEFGPRTLTARIDDGEEPKSDQRSLRIFFERDGTDNPGGNREANWFYYWNQGPVPDLAQFTYDKGTTGAQYDAATGRLTIGRDATRAFGPLSLPLATTLDGGHSFSLERDQVEGIEAVAAAVRHELTHKTLIERAQQTSDSDGDGITIDQEADEASYPPWTSYESGNTYDVSVDVFYGGSADDWIRSARGRARTARRKQVERESEQLGVAGDNELKAIASEKQRGAHADQDWAFPGSQAGH